VRELSSFTPAVNGGILALKKIVDDCVPTRDCLAAERAVATDCLWVIRCHSHEFTGYFEGERRVTLL